MDMTMDNQQERQIADLNWLAGVWESEGWFGMNHNRKKAGSQFGICCGISNTDNLILSEVRRILDAHEVAYWVSGEKVSSLGKKPKHEIVCVGMKRAERLLSLLRPYLRSQKTENVDCILQFISYRKSVPKKHPYGIVEKRLFLRARELNGYKLSESSEITRLAAEVAEDMIRTA